MGTRRRANGVVYAMAWAGAWSAACGGVDAAGPDRSRASIDAATAPDATAVRIAQCSDAAATETDATRNFSSDGGSAADAPVDAGDAGAPLDVSDLATDNEVCHIEWPQVYAFYASENDMHVAVDFAGNAFIAIGYGNNTNANDSAPPIDLGVPSPKYPEGIVIAKIDPDCHLLWMREFGMRHVAGSEVGTSGLGVDANGNVTVAGLFVSFIDLYDGTADAGPVIASDGGDAGTWYGSILMRLDTNGNLVFAKAFNGGLLIVNTLAVTPNGVATISAVGISGADFGGGPVTGTSPDTTSNRYIAQFDATGSVSAVEALPQDTPSYQQLLADPSGGLWAYGYVESDAGNTPSMMRLDSTGGLVWTRLLASDPGTGDMGFAVNATSEVAFHIASPTDETVSFYAPDGTATSSHVTSVDYLGGSAAEDVALDPAGNVLVGGTFYGTPVPVGNGSFVQTPSPAGAGYQRFESAGVLRSMTTWGGSNAVLGSMALAPDGNVVLLGEIQQPTIDKPPPVLFLVKFAAPAPPEGQIAGGETAGE
ncbi:MAG TPA: hypothetical protein VK762_08145 [Polyangiaceae bacterium]|jgi:hypothetical protein|nr:hypothetical protein [Polyangiaceae bacterium]